VIFESSWTLNSASPVSVLAWSFITFSSTFASNWSAAEGPVGQLNVLNVRRAAVK